MGKVRTVLQLSPEETVIAEKIGTELSEKTMMLMTLEGLVRDWITFVIDVEFGYKLTIWDYTNDLSIRDILDSIMDEVPPPMSAKIAAAVTHWDKQFEEVTDELDRPLGHFANGKAPPWWFRVPKRLSDELPSDRETWKGIVD